MIDGLVAQKLGFVLLLVVVCSTCKANSNANQKEAMSTGLNPQRTHSRPDIQRYAIEFLVVLPPAFLNIQIETTASIASRV